MADAPQVVAGTAPQVVPSDHPEALHRKTSKGLVEINGPNGQTKRVNLEELSNADAQLAAQFGYKPVFKREFGYLSTFSFAVSISGLFSTIMTTFVYPISAGGSAAAVWCWLISGAGCMCIAVRISRAGITLGKTLITMTAPPPLYFWKSPLIGGTKVIRSRIGLGIPHIGRLVSYHPFQSPGFLPPLSARCELLLTPRNQIFHHLPTRPKRMGSLPQLVCAKKRLTKRKRTINKCVGLPDGSIYSVK